jgi:hypothetical protein
VKGHATAAAEVHVEDEEDMGEEEAEAEVEVDGKSVFEGVVLWPRMRRRSLIASTMRSAGAGHCRVSVE